MEEKKGPTPPRPIREKKGLTPPRFLRKSFRWPKTLEEHLLAYFLVMYHKSMMFWHTFEKLDRCGRIGGFWCEVLKSENLKPKSAKNDTKKKFELSFGHNFFCFYFFWTKHSLRDAARGVDTAHIFYFLKIPSISHDMAILR